MIHLLVLSTSCDLGAFSIFFIFGSVRNLLVTLRQKQHTFGTRAATEPSSTVTGYKNRPKVSSRSLRLRALPTSARLQPAGVTTAVVGTVRVATRRGAVPGAAGRREGQCVKH